MDYGLRNNLLGIRSDIICSSASLPTDIHGMVTATPPLHSSNNHPYIPMYLSIWVVWERYDQQWLWAGFRRLLEGDAAVSQLDAEQ